jgi:hypothetical protein
MYDLDSQTSEPSESPSEQPGSDIVSRFKGLQASLQKRTTERDTALAEAAAAQAELEAVRSQIESAPREPLVDYNRAPKQRYENPDPLANISWSEIGLPDRDR